jgi:electron-transferring-flavoprotein dehydrogenase
VIEKASEIGAHSLSGAVMNPSALAELVPDFKEKGAPLDAPVGDEAVYFLGRKWSFKFPILPPPFHNHGNYVVSLSKLNRWLGQQCEAAGVNIFAGFAATEAIYEGDKVVGVVTGDKGLDKDGKPKSNFEAGLNLRAKVTVFGEGTRGSLFKKVAKKLGLRDGRSADVYEEGVKEIIQMPKGTVKPGQVIHTMGWPIKKSMGGTFIYTNSDDQIILGLVAYLDSKDPMLDPHRELQRLKTHPLVFDMIKGGKVIAYGGKTLPAGGYYSMPKLYADGMLVIGDSASMVDVQRLKGIHLGMKSGMLAAETMLEALVASDFSATRLKKYEDLVRGSFIGRQLKRVRNFHQALSLGWIKGFFHIAMQEISGGRGLIDPMPFHQDAKATRELVPVWGPARLGQAEDLSLPKPDGVLFFDKLSSVYLTGTKHDEHSPNHLLLQNGSICQDTCHPKFGSPCVQFCPASVYEMIPTADGSAKKQLQIKTIQWYLRLCMMVTQLQNYLLRRTLAHKKT